MISMNTSSLLTSSCLLLLTCSPLCATPVHEPAALLKELKERAKQPGQLPLAPGIWKVSQSVTIPAHLHLVLQPGARWEVDEGATLTIEGSLTVIGQEPIFSGKGEVRFGDRYPGEVRPQWWAKIEGKDDTEACRKALASGAAVVRFNPGTYAINVDGQYGLTVASHTSLRLDRGAILSALPTAKDTYAILLIKDVEKISVEGGEIRGEREAHLGEKGEWGFGIRVENAKEVTLRDLKVSDCWGDGIYVTGTTEQLFVERCIFDNHRRNACSIIAGRDLFFKQCIFSNTNGTLPQAGVDVEPNLPGEMIQNVTFEDCRTYRNASSGYVLTRNGGQEQPVVVTFRNCISEEDKRGFSIGTGPSDCAGVMVIENCTVLNPKMNGFSCSSANLQIYINGLYIFNPNQSGSEKPKEGSGLVVWSGPTLHWSDAYYPDKIAGNINARQVHLSSTDGKALFAVAVGNEGKGEGVGNLDIELRTNMEDAKRFHQGKGPFYGYNRIAFADNPVAISLPTEEGERRLRHIPGATEAYLEAKKKKKKAK